MQNNSSGSHLTEHSTVVLTRHHHTSELDQELIILDSQSEAYFGIDGTGAALWKLIEAPQSVSALYDFLLKHYDVEPAQGWADLLSFLQQLADAKLIEVLNDPE